MARSGKSALHNFKPRLKVLQYIQFPCIGLSKYINLTEDFQLRKPSNISRRNSFKCNSNPCSWFVNLQMNIRLPVFTVVVTISLKTGLVKRIAVPSMLSAACTIQMQSYSTLPLLLLVHLDLGRLPTMWEQELSRWKTAFFTNYLSCNFPLNWVVWVQNNYALETSS